MKTLEKDFKGTKGKFTIRETRGGNIYLSTHTWMKFCKLYGMEGVCSDETRANARLFVNSKKVIEAVMPFLKLANECLHNSGLNKDQVVYAYNKAEITMQDFRNLETAINESL
jgi:hypothetical protein